MPRITLFPHLKHFPVNFISSVLMSSGNIALKWSDILSLSALPTSDSSHCSCVGILVSLNKTANNHLIQPTPFPSRSRLGFPGQRDEPHTNVYVVRIALPEEAACFKWQLSKSGLSLLSADRNSYYFLLFRSHDFRHLPIPPQI